MDHLSRGNYLEVVTVELPSAPFRDYVATVELTNTDQLSKVIESHARHKEVLTEMCHHVAKLVGYENFLLFRDDENQVVSHVELLLIFLLSLFFLCFFANCLGGG